MPYDASGNDLLGCPMRFFKLGVRPGKAKTSLDDRTIAQLATVSADLRLPRDTIHYLYLPSEGRAQLAASELAGRDRKFEVRRAATGPNWVVIVKQTMVVSPASIGEIRKQIEAVAKRHGGQYDGWEAAVTAD